MTDVYWYEINLTLGAEVVASILEQPDPAAMCKRAAAAALEADEPRRMDALLSLRRLAERRFHLLADGTVVRIGLRVVLAKDVYAVWKQEYHWDDKVHVITSLFPLDGGAVECGPRQIATMALRLAPDSPDAALDILTAVKWVDVNGDAEVARRLRAIAETTGASS